VDVNEDLLKETVGTITSSGGVAEAFGCDVTDSTRVNEVVKQIADKWGSVNILVNNAGITRDGMLMNMKDDQWDMVLNINLRGTFLFTRAVARPMVKARGGRIINMASVAGQMGNPGQANYSASKSGVIGFTRTVALELAKRNITVNAIAPGFIATDMTAALGEKILEEVKTRIPLGRMGQPEDSLRIFRKRSCFSQVMPPLLLPGRPSPLMVV
jgi:3-oxoacyl-[acyl-carrier protein] reductase